jgi:hypothetical protein
LSGRHEGNLQGHLTEAQEVHEELTLSTRLAKDLAKGFSGLTVSKSTRLQRQPDLTWYSI